VDVVTHDAQLILAVDSDWWRALAGGPPNGCLSSSGVRHPASKATSSGAGFERLLRAEW
jgi:hypothetical protein